MASFVEFADKKEREAKRHLKIVKKLLEQNGLKVRDHLTDDDDPFLFVVAPSKKLSFDGVRVYQIGSQMAYRVQKEEKTHPYGKAYAIDIEDMFTDYLSDHIEEDRAGKMIVQAVTDEIKKFFDKSEAAEKELRQAEFGGAGDPLGRVVIKSTGTDYSNLVHNQS